MKCGEKSSMAIVTGSGESEDVPVPQFLPSTRNVDVSVCSSDVAHVPKGNLESFSSSSSASSIVSDESSSSITPANSDLTNGQVPIAKNKLDKRSLKRRRSKIADQQQEHQPPQSNKRYGAGLLHTPIPVATCVMPALQELIKGKQELSVGTFRVTAVTSHVWAVTSHVLCHPGRKDELHLAIIHWARLPQSWDTWLTVALVTPHPS